MAYIDINGTTLYYEETGQGLPLLFVHGMCGNAGVWRGQVSRLADRFHCIAYDRRGHTRSPLGDVAERTVQLHADDAAALIQKLGLAAVVLVASSGGARIAFDVVRRYPDLILGAAMSEPPLWGLDRPGAKLVIGEMAPAIDSAVAKGGPRAGVDAFFEYMCPGLWRNLADEAREPYRANHAELFGDLRMPAYQVSPEDLGQISRPCLVLSGTESLPTMQNIARILAGGIPGAKHVQIKGSGHVTYFERPAEFAAAVAEFAGSLGTGRDS